ncbi:hypothetical protein PFISCL1PPCAC_23793, partial [Pristionchus fissidentatus]
DEDDVRGCTKFRFVILILGLLCLVVLQANVLLINLAFICMSDDPSGLYDAGNGTMLNRFDYEPKQKGFIISVVAIGTILGAFLFNWLHQRFGARYARSIDNLFYRTLRLPFFAAGLISAVCTAATPSLAEHSYAALIVGRFLLGVSFSADFAAAGVICVAWAPLSETATFIGVLLSFGPIAFSFTNPVVGAFCTSSFGWRASFYTFGVITCVLFTIWLIVYKDEPRNHKFVTKSELKCIEANKTDEHVNRDGFVPYRDICKNKTVIVVWINSMIEVNTVIILLTYAPTYFNKVLGFTVAETSFYSSLGSIIHSPLKILVAVLSDHATCVSERLKLCFFNTIATALAGLACLSIGFVPSREMGVAALTLTCTLMAANAGGFLKCGVLVSRQYSHFVMSQMQMTKCFAHLIGPTMVSLLTSSDHDSQGWRNVYMINCGLLIVANFLFYPFATDEPAAFTKITKGTRKVEKKEKKKMKKEKQAEMRE